jgi:hypothetical protein
MPTVTGEVHRPQARFSPVNFTEYPRFLMPANTGGASSAARRKEKSRERTQPKLITPRRPPRRPPSQHAPSPPPRNDCFSAELSGGKLGV